MKRLLLAAGIFSAFMLGYGVIANAWPNWGRNEYYGYFQNDYDAYGADVWEPNVGPSACKGTGLAMHTGINTKSEFINFVKCKLNNGNSQEVWGARFIIQTMRGGTDHASPTSSDITDWENRVNNPDVTVDWGASDVYRSYTINSYYQGTGSGVNTHDDAFFDDSDSSNYVVRFIYSGSVRYQIRRACGNPLGALSGLPPNPAFNVSGTSTVEAPGIPPGTNIQVTPGTVLTWRHVLTSNAATSPQTIDWTTHSQTGVQYNSGSVGTMGANAPETANVYTFTAPATIGSVHCRYIRWTPDSQVGGTSQSTQACATVIADYNLVPDVTPSTTQAEVGDTITFTYTVANPGTTDSPAAQCTVRDGGGALVSGLTLNCSTSHVFPAGTTANDPPDSPVGTENYVVPGSAVGGTVCRQLRIAPATPTVASADSALRCVTIVAKPYMRVFGGDVSAGNGLTNGAGVCTSNPNAVVVGWNRGNISAGNPGNYGGAGAQYAVMALNRIQWFSAALGNTNGAPEPRGLSFAANTTSDTSGGFYGGLFGSLPCTPDYYATRPASTLALPATVAGMTSGSYGGTGPVVLGGGGIVNPNNRISVYIDGDVLINGNITYSGSWSVANMPMFRMIVRGNIFIDNDVTQLDGLYVAQRNGASGGIIYTCTTAALGTNPLPPSDPAFYTTCDNKLTVNGALVSHQVQLGRTVGTVSLGQQVETGATSNAAEVFNYSPIMWIPQPTGSGNTGYDAITTLPPVL